MTAPLLQPPADRDALGLPPLPLSATEVDDIVHQLVDASGPAARRLVAQLADRVAPGVDDAARAKAAFLASVARGERTGAALDRSGAVALLGTMVGGYNVAPLVELLDDADMAAAAATELAKTLLVYDAFHDVVDRARAGNPHAADVLAAWADATWFTSRPEPADALHLTVFRVHGEVNTDDLSPAPEAWSRADIPLHATTLLARRPDVADAAGTIAQLAAAGRPVAFVADVVGTGSSRKSAVNSLVWHIGHDVAHIPNKRRGGVVLGATLAPIFAGNLRDAGTLVAQCPVDRLATGDHVVLRAWDGRLESPAGELLASVLVPAPQHRDEVRAGGRALLLIGRALTERARRALGLGPSSVFAGPPAPGVPASGPGPGTSGGDDDRPITAAHGYTLAQKIVGRACGLEGVAPGTACEPVVSAVGSQDTTGPMNRAELEELACLGFSADLVLQTFCHTAAYPKPVDIVTQATLPRFMVDRGGVSLRPGDGIIHSWLNRMVLPDQVGTGSDSHTRFPLGISFPAGSGLVAFAAALGRMPLDMPESVLVRFHGERRPGITVRDLVNAVPFVARREGLLSVGAVGKRNVFSGKIIEFAGLDGLSVEQVFELTDSSAERSAAAATAALDVDAVARYLRSNVELLNRMVDDGYEDRRALQRRAEAMQRWLEGPELLQADAGASYAAVLDIDVAAITEPLLACPNDPDDVRPLSEIAGRGVDEVFIGSCMTDIGQLRTAAQILERAGQASRARLWVAPPTAMDEAALRNEGAYSVFAAAGARTEIPGCSLCMGNQARVAPGSTVVSTSTRNFPNRMGDGASVFLGSAAVAAVAALEGQLPTVAAYRRYVAEVDLGSAANASPAAATVA